jgi:cardiolipin synthase
MRKITRIFKRIYSAVFSRLTLTAAVLLIQLFGFPLLLLRLADYAVWLRAAGLAISILMCLGLFRSDYISPEFKVSWMVVFAIMPVPGGILYLLWGNKRPAFRMRRRLERQSACIRPLLRQAPAPVKALAKADPRGAMSSRYVQDYGPYPVFSNTETTFYPMGEAVFADILPALESAQHFIFIEFFIVGLGSMWNQIHDILKRKAAAGVDVRVIYDDVGSVNVLPIGYWRKLEAEGIHSLPFNPFLPVLNLMMNNRDHRKIMVIDGHTAFSGGFNLSDEYINVWKRFGQWRDHGIRLRGDAAWSFTTMFLEFWNANRPTDSDFERFRPALHHPEPFPGDGFVQPYSDSPVDREALARNVYLDLINQSEHTLDISTPYLILDDDIKTALCIAAKRGVRVRIFTPGIPDKIMTYQLTRSYFPALLSAGVHIYSYTPGFLHAKTWLVDDRIGAVGSINLDYRSLYLHFECSTLLYGCSALKAIHADMEDICAQSRELGLPDCRNSFFGTLLSGLLRMLAPVF